MQGDKPRPKLRTDSRYNLPCQSKPSQELQKQLDQYNITERGLTHQQKNSLMQVLKDHECVFARNPYDLGLYTGGKHKIDTGDAAPIRCNPRKMAYHKRQLLRKELDNMLRIGIIQPSTSSWASPILFVPKKDGSWRLCVDYRDLNKVARTCAHPLPRISDILATFEGKRYFTSIDLLKGFHQIGLDHESILKTAFATVFGQFEFLRLPFGLNSAPAIFQAAMTEALAGIQDVHVYIDDVIIYTATFEEHLATLQAVLQRLIKVNLKVKLSKCEFGRTELLYLGHVINHDGIHTDPDKIKAVADLPEPASVHDIEVFLGKVNYYNKFIPNYSKVAKPLF
jgi:hypothetical protein